MREYINKSKLDGDSNATREPSRTVPSSTVGTELLAELVSLRAELAGARKALAEKSES